MNRFVEFLSKNSSMRDVNIPSPLLSAMVRRNQQKLCAAQILTAKRPTELDSI